MKRRIGSLLALIVLFCVPLFGVVQAQQSGQGLEISPPVIDEQVDPGQTIQLEIRVRNVTDTEVIAKGALNDFEAAGEDGQPKILLDENADASPYTFKPWVTSVPDLRLAPKEAKTTSITINVPKDASPGGHYGVVRFTAVPVGIDDSGVSLSASIGTLVLLSVSGDVVTQGNIEEFTISQNGSTGSFFEYGPITFTERIKNTGNVHFKPSGTVKVKDTLGREVASLAINDKNGNVLPNSIRKFEQTLDKKNLFGRYTAQLDVIYGDNQTMTQTQTFWVVPYKMVLAVLGGLLLIILLIVFLVKRFKKHVADEVHHEDAIKYGHEAGTPPQHTPGMVHHPEDSVDQQPPQDNPPKIQ